MTELTAAEAIERAIAFERNRNRGDAQLDFSARRIAGGWRLERRTRARDTIGGTDVVVFDHGNVVEVPVGATDAAIGRLALD